MPSLAPSFLFALAFASALPAQFAFETRALQHFPADGLQALRTSCADFDGDGDLDAVVTGSTGSTTLQRFYRNDGRGVFTADPAWPDVGNGANHLVADVDGDGDADVLLDGVVVRNLGGGVLQATPTPTLVGWPLACADFDGDGLRDVFVRTATTNGSALFRQTGGAFAPAAVPTNDVFVTDAAARDFDGDGDVDLLLAARPWVIPFGANWPGNDRLWRNDGLGQFTEQYLPGAPNLDTPAMVVADFDLDGDHDCVLRIAAFGWELRRNDGSGNLLSVTGHLPPNLPPVPLHGVDLDGDGDRDLASSTSWLENDGTAHFATRVYVEAVPQAVASDHGDVDGDGDLDLLLANGAPPRLLLNLAPGRLVDASRTTWSRATAATGDVDGDGDLDLLAVPGTLAGVLGINDGTGWFTESPFPWPDAQVLPQSVQIVDVDGDNDRDVLCVLSLPVGGTQLRLFRNQGTGTFVDAGPTGMPTLSSFTTNGVAFDADGDGDRDYVTVVRQGGLFLFANDGAGAFSAVPGAFPPYTGWLQALAVGDLDGDGDIDVLTGDESYGTAPSQLRYFVNVGGIFADVSAQRLQAPLALIRSLAVADIDADGDLDAFAACWGTASYPNSVNLLLRNNGAGTLTHVPAALPAVLPTGTVALGDLDDDGDLDAVVGTYQGGVRFWRNQGAATFADVGGMFPLPSTVGYQAIRIADLDDDLDGDLLIGDGVLSNAHWNAHRARLCRIGELLPYTTSTLTGATVVQPFFALQFARLPVPPFGTLAVPVGAPLLLPPMALTSGAAQVSYPIPPIPGLVGLELVLQSAFLGGTAAHLSPAVRLPVID